jgi:translocation and assembly module TamB
MAPDGTNVLADFVGPLESGKLTLRSEPSRPKHEVFAMILFGTADGRGAAPAASRPAGSGATPAVGAGSALLAQGLTEAIDDLSGVRAQARVDTSRVSNPRPEVEVQLTRRITLELSHVLGTPPIAQPDKNYATVTFRVGGRWSVETTFGDKGHARVDAVWQTNY